MPVESDCAIILRLTDYSETSQIVTLFSAEHGLLRLIAKGAKRATKTRVSVSLDLLEYGDATFVAAKPDAGLGTLAEWRLRDAFSGLRGELAALYGGLYAAELTLALTHDYDPHPALFAALLDLLNELARSAGAANAGKRGASRSDAIFAALVRFQAEFLKSIGYAPNLRQCVACGRARMRGARAWFSSRAGGLLCETCQVGAPEKQPIDARLLDGARGTTPQALWFALLDYHLTHVAGRAWLTGGPLRMALAAAQNAL